MEKLIKQNLSKFYFHKLNLHAQLIDCVKAPSHFIFTEKK